ncbi:hypothetical protein [Streptomyces sp. NPDC056387]|uniref:hypothetical protein n=1 Tax=Streptomyces sp. NPDC056387 TaxID=3345803 RepID=UPI0035E2FD2A
MNTPSAVPRAGGTEQKPGWFLTAALVGALSLLLRLTDTWSWWAFLWAPLLGLAIGSATYEWRLTARSRWRMPPVEWLLLIAAHLSLGIALADVGGFLPR